MTDFPTPDTEALQTLIASLHQADSAINVLQRLGHVLQQYGSITPLCIGYPSSTDPQDYWLTDHHNTQPVQIHLTSNEILSELQSAPYHILEVSTRWFTAVLQESIAWVNNQNAQTTNRLTWIEQTHYLAACYTRESPTQPWLLGWIPTDTQTLDPSSISALGLYRDIATLALEQQIAVHRNSRIEQLQRQTTNRLMDWLRIATEGSRQVIYEWEIESDQMEWSASLPATFGHLPSQDPQDRTWWLQRIHPDDRAWVTAQVSDCLTDLRPFLCDYRWQRADGYYAWVRDYGRILCGAQGKPVRMIGSLKDSTVTHGTSAALLQLKHSFQLALEAATDGILVTTPEARVIEVNSAFLTMVGYDRQQLAQLDPLTLIIHPADVNADEGLLQRLLSSTLSDYTTHKRFYHAQGYECPTTITVTALWDGQGSNPQLFWRVQPQEPSEARTGG